MAAAGRAGPAAHRGFTPTAAMPATPSALGTESSAPAGLATQALGCASAGPASPRNAAWPGRPAAPTPITTGSMPPRRRPYARWEHGRPENICLTSWRPGSCGNAWASMQRYRCQYAHILHCTSIMRYRGLPIVPAGGQLLQQRGGQGRERDVHPECARLRRGRGQPLLRPDRLHHLPHLPQGAHLPPTKLHRGSAGPPGDMRPGGASWRKTLAQALGLWVYGFATLILALFTSATGLQSVSVHPPEGHMHTCRQCKLSTHHHADIKNLERRSITRRQPRRAQRRKLVPRRAIAQ